MNDNMIIDLSKKLFELFVINDNTIAFQTGKYYIPRQFKYDYKLIELMVRKNESLGVYQQPFKRDYVRWICIDFDCKEVTFENVNILINVYLKKCLKTLKENNVNYLIEFSGRRGIHIWIIYDSLIKKEDAFKLISEFTKDCIIKEEDEDKLHIDLFPKSDKKGNKYGSLVKLPLSTHKRGGKSFFITEEQLDSFTFERYDSINLISQLEIINSYEVNLFEEQMKFPVENYPKYKKQFISKSLNLELSINDLESKLCGSIAFKKLFSKIKMRTLNNLERQIIVTCFGGVSDELVLEILKYQTNFDEGKTLANIKKVKKTYNPITMQYFYNFYRLEMEPNIDPSITTLEYILNSLSIDLSVISCEITQKIATKTELDIQSIILKELNYMQYNDEVFDFNDYISQQIKNLGRQIILIK